MCVWGRVCVCVCVCLPPSPPIPRPEGCGGVGDPFPEGDVWCVGLPPPPLHSAGGVCGCGPPSPWGGVCVQGGAGWVRVHLQPLRGVGGWGKLLPLLTRVRDPQRGVWVWVCSSRPPPQRRLGAVVGGSSPASVSLLPSCPAEGTEWNGVHTMGVLLSACHRANSDALGM